MNEWACWLLADRVKALSTYLFVRSQLRNHARGPQPLKRPEPGRVRLPLLLKPDPPHLLQTHMPIKREMIAVLIQRLRFEDATTLPTPSVPNIFMHLNELTRFQQALLPSMIIIIINRPRAFKTKVIGNSRPALAHARRARPIRDIEQLTAAARFRTEGSPDGESGNDVRGGVVEAGVVSGSCAGKGDLGAFAMDERVQG